MKRKTRYIAVTTLVLACIQPAVAQMENEEMHGGKPIETRQADKKYKADLKKYKDNDNFLVLPGLVADRKGEKVDVLCETTALEARESSEYIIVNQYSSHGYEAMLWSYAKASDLHKALEFIGVKAGAPRDYSQLRFWSKGERITASLLIDDDAIPLERLIYDTETKRTLPEEGWIFTGSAEINNPTGGTGRVYLADEYDPRSIIAAYNEPASVLDPPWQATKGEFYESHVASPEFDVQDHELVTVRFEPKLKGGKKRIRDLTMDITKEMAVILKDAKSGKLMGEQKTFESALQECKKIRENDGEPYVRIQFDDALTLSAIQRIATILIMIDNPDLFCVEPPKEGRLYYKAFVPNRRWLNKTDRMTQPWELHVKEKDSKLSGTLMIHDEHWESGKLHPNLTKRTYDVASGAEIRSLLDKETKDAREASRRPPPPVLLIYAAGKIQYGSLRNFIKPAIATHSTVHLFLDEQEEVDSGRASPPVQEKVETVDE